MSAALRTPVALALVVSAACGGRPMSRADRAASPLRSDSCVMAGETNARCGTLMVREDRSRTDGRWIALNFVVLPARNRAADDAVVFLAGGPGQAATASIAARSRDLAAIRETRDLVFLDQRGTGKSNPLQCNLGSTAQAMTGWLTGAFDVDSLVACRQRLSADVRRYFTLDAIDDLDELRGALGYEQLDLIGGSYGTRVALEYMRRYPNRSRVAILRGVYAPHARLPLFVARDAEMTLRRRSSECAALPECRAMTPNLRLDVVRLLDSLAVRRPGVPLGGSDTLTLTREIGAGALLFSLYEYQDPRDLARATQAAANGDYSLLLGSGLLIAATVGGSASVGMYLSVVCTGDLPFISDKELSEASEGTFIGSTLVTNLRRSCAAWRALPQPSSILRPVASTVPTLVVSGDADPVTTPLWGDEVVRHLEQGLHLVLPRLGHVPWATACANRIMADLVQSGRTSGLNLECDNNSGVAAPQPQQPLPPVSPQQRAEVRNVTGLWDLYWTSSTGKEALSGWIRLCQTSADRRQVTALVGGQGELPAAGQLIGDSLHLTGRRVVEFTVAGRFVDEELHGALKILTSNRGFIARRHKPDGTAKDCVPQ